MSGAGEPAAPVTRAWIEVRVAMYVACVCKTAAVDPARTTVTLRAERRLWESGRVRLRSRVCGWRACAGRCRTGLFGPARAVTLVSQLAFLERKTVGSSRRAYAVRTRRRDEGA